MDIPEVTDEMMAAGREFDEALVKLGFRAHQVLWGYDLVLNHHVLLIMTDLYEVHGPLEINRLMFKAYSASLLPQEVDPFFVRVHSIDQPAAAQIASWSKGGKISVQSDKTGEFVATDIDMSGGTINDVHVQRHWRIVERPLGHRARQSLTRQFRKFADRIEKLAA